MDDSADKLRRNLVVFSAAVIAAEYLGVKLTDYLTFLTGPGKEAVEALASLRGRVLIVFVFLYLLARWNSSDERRKADRDLHLRWLKSLNELSAEIATIRVEKAEKSDQLPPWLKVDADIGGFTQFKSNVAQHDAEQRAKYPPSWNRTEYWGDAPRFSFRLERVRRSITEEKIIVSGISARVHVDIPGGMLQLLKLRLAYSFAIEEQPALVVIAPKILALIALVILLTKLFQ